MEILTLNKKNIVIFGGGGHAKSCLDVLYGLPEFNVLGFLDTNLNNKLIFGYKNLLIENEIRSIRNSSDSACIGVGFIKNLKLRNNIIDEVNALNFKLPKIISKKSYVSNFSNLEDGTIVMHGVLINSAVNISSNCIINSKSLIEHDCTISSNVHISTGVTLNGGVNIGSNSFIGSGSIINQGVTIGKNCIIGSMTKISKDLKDFSIIDGDKLVEKK